MTVRRVVNEDINPRRVRGVGEKYTRQSGAIHLRGVDRGCVACYTAAIMSPEGTASPSAPLASAGAIPGQLLGATSIHRRAPCMNHTDTRSTFRYCLPGPSALRGSNSHLCYPLRSLCAANVNDEFGKGNCPPVEICYNVASQPWS
ncbi:hypothetical protein Bbelb_147400 [Branchiostoma belcheri]|nr:hypothetical protein Bbelb_147400 [Branchiostoma belcheri]